MTFPIGKLNSIWGEPIYKGKIDFNDPLGPISIDTRTLAKGNFFVPLIGVNFNGHHFLEVASRKGAQAAVVSKKSGISIPESMTCWEVDDTLSAFHELSLLSRLNLNIPVVAITGSVGKTTTREIIKSLLSPLGKILSTDENKNNEVGVPLTLVQASSEHVAAVIEMGMRGIGEIEKLSFCAQPDIAVITNIGTAHIGRLGSRNQIAKAKCEITSYLRPSGVVIIPGDDPLLENTLKKNWSGRIKRVKLKGDYSDELNNCSNSNIDLGEELDCIGELDLKRSLVTIQGNICELPLPGRHNALNFVLSVAVARELNVPWAKIMKTKVSTPGGRNSRIQLKGITIFDETYNSSLESVKAALELLITQPGRHFAVLGTMLELGSYSIPFHKIMIEEVLRLGLDGLVVVSEGAEAEAMSFYLKELSKFIIVSDAEEAIKPLNSWLKPGDNLLLKGSRRLSLERIINLLR